MKEKWRYEKKISNKFNIILLVVLTIVLVGTTVAKFIFEENFETAYKANNFYFNSDLLSVPEENLEYVYPRGLDEISFSLINYDDSLRISEINYDYIVNLEKDNEIIDTKTGTLLKNQMSSETIKFDGLSVGEYLVTAKVESPYKKILTAKFSLLEEDENIEYVVNTSEETYIVEVKVTTKEYNGNISITYPEGVVPDNTDVKIENGASSNTIKSVFEKDSSYTFVFLKNDKTDIYAKEDFSVERSS